MMADRDILLAKQALIEINDIYSFLSSSSCKTVIELQSNKMLAKAVVQSLTNLCSYIDAMQSGFLANLGISLNILKPIRNTAAHNYGTINWIFVWAFIKDELPRLKSNFESV